MPAGIAELPLEISAKRPTLVCQSSRFFVQRGKSHLIRTNIEHQRTLLVHHDHARGSNDGHEQFF
jgi:hypothetical protein